MGAEQNSVRSGSSALCGNLAAAAAAWRRERAAAIRHGMINEPHASADFGCAFRRLQPSIPIETSHRFRTKPAGHSDDPSRVAVRAIR
jgi:hypothetical protein